MLTTLGKLFSAPGWIYELKHDGFRCLASKVGDTVRLLSRNGNDMSERFPEVADAMRAIPADLVVDGELVICDDLGCPQWSRLQKRHVIRRADRVREAAAKDPACVFAFDLLWLNGEDYRNYPLVIRKAMLAKTPKGSKRIIYATHFENSAAELWALAKKFELEGIVAKDGSSIYTAGRTRRLVEFEQRSRLDESAKPCDPAWAHEQRGQAKHEAINGCQIRSALSRAITATETLRRRHVNHPGGPASRT